MELNLANETYVEVVGWDPANWHARLALGPSTFPLAMWT